MSPNPEQLRQILASGILAPSAENKHYLRFTIQAKSVQLISTDRLSWAERPHRQLLALLFYGAVVENIALRSAELGFALTTAWFPDGPTALIADLRWTVATTPPEALGTAIEDRHTNRRFYRRDALPPQTLARLSAAADGVPGATLLWLNDAPSRSLALKAIRIAETERFRCRALHAELFDSIRFEIGWHQICDEWLPPATLQVEPGMRMPFALMRHWSVMRADTWVGAHLALGLRAGLLPCALAPHLGLILGKNQREELGNLQAGRAFQRVWLAATAETLALQPMASATVLVRQLPGNGWVWVSVKHELQQLLDTLCRPSRGKPYMLFRVGKAAAPAAVTARKPLDSYLD